MAFDMPSFYTILGIVSKTIWRLKILILSNSVLYYAFDMCGDVLLLVYVSDIGGMCN